MYVSVQKHQKNYKGFAENLKCTLIAIMVAYIVYWMPFGYQINLNNCSLSTACEAFIHINVQATSVLLRIYMSMVIYMVSIRNAKEKKNEKIKSFCTLESFKLSNRS